MATANTYIGEAILTSTAQVGWTVGYTLNTGNFQSLRLDFDVKDFVHEGETLEEATERVYKFAEQTLSAKLKEAREELV